MEDWMRDVMESRTGELKYTEREEPEVRTEKCLLLVIVMTDL